jgi:y4mF family transcriptional regulator
LLNVIIIDVEQIGKAIRAARKQQGLTQSELALTANTAQRFVSKLERGKATCQIGKILDVTTALGIRIELHPPGD